MNINIMQNELAKRYASAVAMASIVTFALFFIMQMLVASGDVGLDDSKGGKIIDMVRVDRDETIQSIVRKPERPPEIEEAPPEIEIMVNPNRPTNEGVSFARVDVNMGANLGGTGFGGNMDGDYLPIVKPQPVYPRRAQERGISGHVLVEFTVTETGSVEDVVVILAEPPGYFERAAIRAAEKFKYKPKVINGEPQRTAGVQNDIIFEMED